MMWKGQIDQEKTFSTSKSESVLIELNKAELAKRLKLSAVYLAGLKIYV